ncbi:hypothetical protein MKK55_18690 [Methylobacterium sp. J-059]|uniref:hypothetical protein n=1 Tax=Methylobacterium sp. J-059 TaxID=2836643 RepID=UPI001FBAA19D|nr:hypothetical protein [Methylobacterium sp. J-059]MCJ2040959.1 hypothetical protein [Methylobacterium sp. J-059]
MEPEVVPDIDYVAVESSPYSIVYGQAFVRPIVPPDPKMSRRRRRRLRGKRKAGLLPPWGYQLLGDVVSFTLKTKLAA